MSMAESPTDPALATGAMVGRFRIEQCIGSGGVGAVYAAADTARGDSVAIKVLKRVLADDATLAARFEREASAVRAVKHRSVVEILDIGRLPDGRPYLVMPLLNGRSLRDEIISRARPLPPVLAWTIAREMAEALDAAHALGVVHRDLKPDNVFLEHAGDGSVMPRLLDFGIAKVEQTGSERKLTETGSPLGTPGYMSPEQWWNKSVGPATDQYALGAMVFELLAARLPFTTDNFVELMQSHLTGTPPTLASVGIEATPAMESWVARALAKKPEQRFASMRAMIDAGDLAFGVVSTARRPRVAIAVAMALLPPAAILAAGYGGLHNPLEWIRLAGWGIWPVLLAFAVGVVCIAIKRPAAAIWAALSAAAAGSFGTYTGWMAVIRALERTAPGFRFELFNEGLFEANVNRFTGFFLSGGLVLAAIASDPPAGRDPRATREAVLTSAAVAVLCAVAIAVNAPAGALVAGGTAIAHALAMQPPRTAVEELGRGLRRVLAVLLIGAGAVAHSEARSAVLWTTNSTRAVRAAAAIAASVERTSTLTLWLVCIAVTVGFAVARMARAHRGPRFAMPGKASIALLVTCVAGAIGDTVLHAQLDAHRDSLWATLAPQFAVFSRLDPPGGNALAEPGIAPSLRLARDVIAVDAERVGLLASLDSPEGSAALAYDLGHRLARETTAPRDSDPQLLIIADRSIAWRPLSRALTVAYGVGVRRADVLLTRGPAPTLGQNAPPEAAYALPRDFGAVRIELTAGDGMTFASETRFETVARELVGLSTAGSVRVRIER